MTLGLLFAAFFHLLLKCILIMAAIVGTPAIIAVIVLLILEPGTFRQRIRNLGGGT